jgi:hypothetical protein
MQANIVALPSEELADCLGELDTARGRRRRSTAANRMCYKFAP